jgi:hypothetical protein
MIINLLISILFLFILSFALEKLETIISTELNLITEIKYAPLSILMILVSIPLSQLIWYVIK